MTRRALNPWTPEAFFALRAPLVGVATASEAVAGAAEAQRASAAPRLRHRRAYSGHRLKLGGPSVLPPSPRPAQLFPYDARLGAGLARLYATFTRAAGRAGGMAN